MRALRRLASRQPLGGGAPRRDATLGPCNPMPSSLQPYAIQPQPYAIQPATLCHQVRLAATLGPRWASQRTPLTQLVVPPLFMHEEFHHRRLDPDLLALTLPLTLTPARTLTPTPTITLALTLTLTRTLTPTTTTAATCRCAPPAATRRHPWAPPARRCAAPTRRVGNCCSSTRHVHMPCTCACTCICTCRAHAVRMPVHVHVRTPNTAPTGRARGR